MILGIVGNYGSGKDSVASMLMKFGFSHYSLSDEIRNDLLKKRDNEGSREELIKHGNYLRKKFGNSVLAKRALENISKKTNHAVVTSIRNVDEVRELKKHNFKLIYIYAPQKTRYEWLKKRSRFKDIKTFKDFQKFEKQESKGKSHEQNINSVIKMADIVLKNDKNLKQLELKVKKILKDLHLVNKSEGKYKRPSWDRYFMDVMESISRRGTCDRGRSGCVIARDNQLLVTGYVGSPVGFPHCDDVGHQFKKVIHEDNMITEHCVRTVHAEQNAICQAAKNGVSLQRSTLYCRMTPCRVCAMLLINSGIKRIVCERKYHAGKESEEMLKKAKIKLEYFYDELQEYKK